MGKFTWNFYVEFNDILNSNDKKFAVRLLNLCYVITQFQCKNE